MKETISLSLTYDHDVLVNKGSNPKRCFVLLHGYLLDGDYIYNKLLPILNEDDLIIAPNGPFLIPVEKKETHIPKYSWYFFDVSSETYYINFEPAAEYVNHILNYYNTENLPVTIIGYSQGGYLSPKIAEFNSNIKTIIGLACVFRNKKFKINTNTTYHQIHGNLDVIVEKKNALAEWEDLKNRGNEGNFRSLENSGHRIDNEFLAELKRLILL
jgi:predicted esterase